MKNIEFLAPAPLLRFTETMKRLTLLFSLFGFGIGPAIAAPSYYNLTELEADDTLNVRAEPFGTAEIIGTIPPGAQDIEIGVRDASGNWGRIIWNETSGWIAIRFLEQVEPRKFLETALPDGLTCSGTEPFWGLSLRAGGAFFSTPNNELISLKHRLTQVAAGRADFPISLNFDSETHVTVPIIRPAGCNDGMSDRLYPWSIDMIVQSSGQQGFLSGCCHLPFEAGEH